MEARKQITVSVEFEDGSFDFRTINASTFKEAKEKAFSQNDARLKSPLFKHTTKKLKNVTPFGM